MPQPSWAQVGQRVFFEVAPDMFDRIQPGHVAGQPLQREPATFGRNKIANFGDAMSHQVLRGPLISAGN